MKVTQTEDLAACHKLRRIVFIEEQNVSEAEEMDGRDGDAVHFLVHDSDTPIGTARVFVSGDTVKIGRVCVLKDTRRNGAGSVLMHGILDWARKEGLRKASLGAQTYIIPFYERLGFAAYGPEFDDAGIPHRHMDLAL